MRFTKVVAPPGERPQVIGVRRRTERYADRQNIDRKDEPPDEPAVRPPAARPDRPAIRPASYFLMSLAFSTLLFALFFAGERGFLQVRKQRVALRAAQEEVARIDAENRKLETEVAALKSDPRSLEKIAREKLQLVKPGEVVVVLPEGWERRVKPEVLKAPTPSSPADRKP